MLEKVFRSQRVVRRLRNSRLGGAFDEFVAYLIERGYPTSTIQPYVQVAEHFDGWLRRTRRAVADIDEALIGNFLRSHLPRCHCPPPCATTVHQSRASLRHLLIALRVTGRVPQAIVQLRAADQIVAAFGGHLREVAGVAPATCASRERFAREFLAAQFGGRQIDFARVKPSNVVTFFTQRGGRWSRGSMKVAATSLRSFFRYLEVTGRVSDARLQRAVPKIAEWRLASLPRVLSDAQVDAMLTSIDVSTPVGLRDYASTMCLARLGLRTCEVSALTLDDIDWRAGTITVPATKTRRADVLPLSVPVAQAILAYLRRGRPKASTRQIFIRHATPSGAAGPGVVRAAVRRAGARIGLASSLASPNVLRHTVATRLLRSGATMKEISDVLRHRSIDTTAIYAKVDIDALRKVAAPWPKVAR